MKNLLTALLVAFASASSMFAQGTTTITFDGPPPQPFGTRYNVADYVEAGILFTPLYDPYEPGRRLVRNGGGISGAPDNGSAYLQSDPSGVLFRFQNGSLFGVAALDLASFSDVLSQIALQITGYRPDGSSVTANFGGTGIQWRTVQFGPEWGSGLERVEIPGFTDWSIDNITLAVPEPASGALLLCGLAATLAFRKRTAG